MVTLNEQLKEQQISNADAELDAEIVQQEPELIPGIAPGSPEPEPEPAAPEMPTILIVKPALVMVCKTIFAEKISDEDMTECAQAYADALDHYFPDGLLNHPLAPPLLLTAGLFMNYQTKFAAKQENKPVEPGEVSEEPQDGPGAAPEKAPETTKAKTTKRATIGGG